MKPVRTKKQSQPTKHDDGISINALVRKSTVVYGIMIIIGVATMGFFHDSLQTAFELPPEPLDAARILGSGVVAAAVLLVLSYFFEDWFESFRELKSIIMQVLGKASIPMAVYLAALTSVGEELLFRGAIQPFVGVLFTSILFGLLHMGHNGIVSAWSFWALIAGYMLGWMYEETGSLWPPIIAHFGVNTISILSLRRAYHGYASHMKEKMADSTPPPNTDSRS